VTLKAALTVNKRVGVLSGARFLLFASRDMWFEVTLPFFLRDPASGIGWSRVAVGAFLAAWIVAYGQVQAFPRAEINILPGVGHWCWLEDTDGVAGHVLPFLRTRVGTTSKSTNHPSQGA
jgi:pimeloyl-ACP methyl ester carboxylesterase